MTPSFCLSLSRTRIKIASFFLTISASIICLQLQIIRVHNSALNHSTSIGRLENIIVSSSSSTSKTTKQALAYSNETIQREENRQSKWDTSFETDELCGGCRWIPTQTDSHCGEIIAQRAAQENMTPLQVAHDEITNRNHEDCKRCLACPEHQKQYWRPDRVAPKVRKATTHYLPSIPSQNRVPDNVLAQNDDYLIDYFSKPENSFPEKKHRYLFEYNPSIVQLPSSYKMFNFQGETPVYVASYRVATQQSCWSTEATLAMIGGSWKNKPRTRSFVAIALLRKDLSIISDAVLDLPNDFGNREDFRLFVLHDELYLTSYCKITPLYIGTKEEPPRQQHSRRISNRFSSDLRISMAETYMFCSKDNNPQTKAKNLNYFVDIHNQSVVELSPAGNLQSQPQAHRVQPVSLEGPQQYGLADASIERTVPANPSFHTMDELVLAEELNLFESPYTGDRGSACCISIEHSLVDENASKTLLVGVSHVKVPYGRKKRKNTQVTANQYFSRFYAFEPYAPYKTVAISGYFCLSQLAASDYNPLAQRPQQKFLKMGNMTLDCPPIHFITGITEMADDSSKVIIAYGVEDCTSWFIEVDKQEIVDLLWDRPKSH